MSPGTLGDVVLRLSEPWRRYHTVAHVASMLRSHRDGVARGAWQQDDAVELAAWYHDAVYEPGARDNEVRSAELLDAAWASFPDAGMVRRARRLVLATADHLLGHPPDLWVFLDLDLEVLAAERDAYDAYVAGVRVEHAHVDDRSWALGRSGMLRRFLTAGRIYRTSDFFIDRGMEDRARDNLRRELDGLHAQL